MNDVERSILDTWRKIGRKILADPDELNQRLARRRKPLLTRPPRAWCIAIRASDHHITPAHWILVPDHAMELDHPEHPYEPIEHQVIIQTHAIRRYCHPVGIAFPGQEVEVVAKKLGVTPHTLRTARHAGIFSERSYHRLGGKRGKPVPVIFSKELFDPGFGRFFAAPDPLWGAHWEFLSHEFPEDFEQTVTRIPNYRPYPSPGCPKEHWDRRQRGWKWICPGCKKTARTIYYPIAPRSVFDSLDYDPLPFPQDPMPQPLATFACKHCHRVRSSSRISSDAWNHVVSTLSRGLLYGHEVPKPDWYQRQRKRARTRMLNRPAPRRLAVLRRLLNGWTDRQIALDLLMPLATVQLCRLQLCKQEGVANRRELALKLGSNHPQPQNHLERARHRQAQVEKLLLEGLSYREICHRAQIKLPTLGYIVKLIYRKHGLPKRAGRQALGKKLGLEVKRFAPKEPSNTPTSATNHT